MKRRQQVTRDGQAGESGAMIAEMKEAGCEVTADHWLGYIGIDETARFLGTTNGEIYNLTSRGEIPFHPVGQEPTEVPTPAPASLDGSAPQAGVNVTCMLACTGVMHAAMDVREMASLGGKARARKLGRKKLSDHGRKAALARWAKVKRRRAR